MTLQRWRLRGVMCLSSGFCLSTLLRMTHVRSPYHQLAYDNNKQPWNKRYAPTGPVARIRLKRTENMSGDNYRQLEKRLVK